MDYYKRAAIYKTRQKEGMSPEQAEAYRALLIKLNPGNRVLTKRHATEWDIYWEVLAIATPDQLAEVENPAPAQVPEEDNAPEAENPEEGNAPESEKSEEENKGENKETGESPEPAPAKTVHKPAKKPTGKKKSQKK